jgi:hypothetical protein
MCTSIPWAMWKAVTGVCVCVCGGGHRVKGYYDKHWLTGLWCTQAKVEGIMLKAAWHWGRNSSVINDPLGEPGCTPLYISLPSTWGSVDGDRMFSPSFMGQLRNWGLFRGISLHRGPVGGIWRGVPLLRTLTDRWDFTSSGDCVYWGLQDACKRRFWKWAYFATGAPLGEPGGGFVYWGLWQI